MGKAREQPLKINPKLANKNAKMECMDELTAFFGCMSVGTSQSIHRALPW